MWFSLPDIQYRLTNKTVFVDAGDILSNKNVREKLQCLNVAISRAKDELYIINGG